MSRDKTVEHDPKAGAGKPGKVDAPSRPGFRDAANAKSKAQKSAKKKK
jgi:hypothetical protein